MLIGVVGVTIFMDPFYGGKLLPQAHLLLKHMLCPLVDTLWIINYCIIIIIIITIIYRFVYRQDVSIRSTTPLAYSDSSHMTMVQVSHSLSLIPSCHCPLYLAVTCLWYLHCDDRFDLSNRGILYCAVRISFECSKPQDVISSHFSSE